MATHTTPDLRAVISPRPGAARISYDVARTCRGIAISIALIAVFMIALMIL